jgi:Sulfotransferase family
VFVVGCPRSGTTLLQRMLDAHSQLAVANDTHFIPAALKGLDPRADLPLTREIVDRVARFRTGGGMGVHRLGLPEDAVAVAAKGARTYPELVSALYLRLADLRGKAWAGEKTPDYVRHLLLLHTLFPWAKFVHLIRDGRDVTLALVDWAHDKRTGRLRGPARSKLWHTNPVAASALWWKWQVDSGKRDAGEVGSRYLEVRYEALVSRPEETLREVVDFLELPFDAGMLAYHVGRTRAKPGLGTNKAWLPPTQGVRDWRTQMSAHDVELVEALAGDLLSELGYERAFPKISPPVRAEAKQHRKRWARKVARRTARAQA